MSVLRDVRGIGWNGLGDDGKSGPRVVCDFWHGWQSHQLDQHNKEEGQVWSGNPELNVDVLPNPGEILGK